MRTINWLVIITFVFSLLIAAGLDLMSGDYEFVPNQQIPGENKKQPNQLYLTEEMVEKFLRTSGTSEPGNVEIQVIFLNPLQKLNNDYLIFQIALNSHYVNLLNYDITKNAVIKDSSGRIITEGFTWEQINNNKGHHLMGVLMVPDLTSEISLTKNDLEWIKLVIKGIPKIENREFQWDGYGVLQG